MILRMSINISTISEAPFSYEDVVELIHSSFEERLKQGLFFTCSSMTVDQFMNKTENSSVFVAWDPATKTLLGNATVSLRKDKKGIVYGYHEYLAISPDAKRLGIGSMIQKEIVILIIDARGQYIISDTAEGAISSVRWHVKNGFKIIGVRSFSTTNYYSYIFRKQLTPSRLWNSNIYTHIRFRVSSILIKALYCEDGSYTLLGKVVFVYLRRRK